MDKKIPEYVSVHNVIVNKKRLNNYEGLFPNPNCRLCYGRGWDGKLIAHDVTDLTKKRKYYSICRCVETQKGTLTCGIKW